MSHIHSPIHVAASLMLLLTISVAMGEERQPPTFDVRDYNARGDGQVIDTRAIQEAIEACHKSGGGRVLLPPGRYLSGTLHLRDRVGLHLADNARLVGTADLDAYQGFEADTWGKRRWNRGLIVGEGLRDVTITGAGVIDGNKVVDPQGEDKIRGPHAILLADCQGVTLRGITVHESGNYGFLFYGSSKVRIEKVTFEGGYDGVHFRGKPDVWNRAVRITDCKFYTGDDCIAGHYLEDAVVEDCVINSSCNGVRLIGPTRRLSFARCEFFGPGKFEHRSSRNLHRTNMLAAILVQPAAWGPAPGPTEDLSVCDATMRDVACAFHVSIRPGNTADRLTFERIAAQGIYGPAASLENWGDQPLGKVVLRDIDLRYTPDTFIDPRTGKPNVQSPIQKPRNDVFARKLPVWGIYGRQVQTLELDHVQLTTASANEAQPVLRFDNVGKLVLHHVQYPAPAAGTTPIELNAVRAVDRTDTPEAPAPQ